MHSQSTRIEVRYSARGIPSFRVEVWHDGLRKHREIKGADATIVARKAQLQMEEWDTKWSIHSLREAERSSKEQQKQTAAERTEEAKRELSRMETLLLETLSVDDRIDWESLKDNTRFFETAPRRPAKPQPPQPTAPPVKPKHTDPEFAPQLGFLDKLIGSRRRQREAEALQRYTLAHQVWEKAFNHAHESNAAAMAAYEATLRDQQAAHERSVAAWEQRRAEFEERQRTSNAAVDAQRNAYLAGLPDAIVDYCDMVLSASSYPDYFPKEWDLDYNPDTRGLLVEYKFPAPNQVPTLREVKFVQSRGEVSETHIGDSQAAKLYDSALYQIVLRTIHELYEADVIEALQSITFNGLVTSVDRALGKESTACIVSLQASRDEFLAINLEAVDPKACFKALKGIGSSQLHSLTAVPPILQMRRDDGRFVAGREIANTLDDSMNLAAMNWEDFEHLIRELFEKEFASTGGQVMVTQASRDAGVDAVVFDPDPIRGGKIIIQAKRYTNTVGVAAVRDLYGTVVNEGATKGVLVTTSDYGPDAYGFAKDKPLVLLNGANLLYLLEKHGHRAKIDIKAAREQAMRGTTRP